MAEGLHTYYFWDENYTDIVAKATGELKNSQA